MTADSFTTIRTLVTDNPAEVLALMNSAFDLLFNVSVTNNVYIGDTKSSFTVGVLSEETALMRDDGQSLDDAVNAMLDGFTNAVLLDRSTVNPADAVLDPRWSTNMMRLIGVWIPEEGDSESSELNWFLETYDAPIPVEEN
jgi:hypothetical protein